MLWLGSLDIFSDVGAIPRKIGFGVPRKIDGSLENVTIDPTIDLIAMDW